MNMVRLVKLAAITIVSMVVTTNIHAQEAGQGLLIQEIRQLAEKVNKISENLDQMNKRFDDLEKNSQGSLLFLQRNEEIENLTNSAGKTTEVKKTSTNEQNLRVSKRTSNGYKPSQNALSSVELPTVTTGQSASKRNADIASSFATKLRRRQIIEDYYERNLPFQVPLITQ